MGTTNKMNHKTSKDIAGTHLRKQLYSARKNAGFKQQTRRKHITGFQQQVSRNNTNVSQLATNKKKNDTDITHGSNTSESDITQPSSEDEESKEDQAYNPPLLGGTCNDQM